MAGRRAVAPALASSPSCSPRRRAWPHHAAVRGLSPCLGGRALQQDGVAGSRHASGSSSDGCSIAWTLSQISACVRRQARDVTEAWSLALHIPQNNEWPLPAGSDTSERGQCGGDQLPLCNISSTCPPAPGLHPPRFPKPHDDACHRGIGSNGTLTGYGGGLERKRSSAGYWRTSACCPRCSCRSPRRVRPEPRIGVPLSHASGAAR